MGHIAWGPRRGMLTTAAAAAAVVLLAGCTGSTPADGPVSTQTPAGPGMSASTGADDITPHAVGSDLNFECADPIDTGLALDDVAVPDTIGMPDVMAINATAGGNAIQWGGANYKGLKFAKVGLILKIGQTFTLEIPANMRGHVKIGWSNSGYTVADSLAVPGCTTNLPDTKWLVYPGGFWLDAPACVPLTVTHGGDTETLHIPVGASCP